MGYSPYTNMIRNGHIRAERSGGKYKLFVDPEFVDPEFLTAMRVKLTELMNV